jgi:hypothetical protein
LAIPAVYSSEAGTRFIPVYDELAGRYGKIICSAWQSEWRDGPGAREREQAQNIALFPTVRRPLPFPAAPGNSGKKFFGARPLPESRLQSMRCKRHSGRIEGAAGKPQGSQKTAGSPFGIDGLLP